MVPLRTAGYSIDDTASSGVQYYYRVYFRYNSFFPGLLGTDVSRISPYSEVDSASLCNDVPVKGPMDIAFVLDNTGSMSEELPALKTVIDEVLDHIVLSSMDDYRLSLVTTETDIVNVRLPFSQNNRTAFENALSSVPVTGGTPGVASTDECLNTVINGLAMSDRPLTKQIGNDFAPPFGEDDLGNPRSALKLVILLTDALPGGFAGQFNQTTIDRVQQVSVAARMNCIRIAALQFGTNTDAEDIMVNYADSTCGWYAQTIASDPNAIMEMILSTIHEDLPDCGGNPIEGLPHCFR